MRARQEKPICTATRNFSCRGRTAVPCFVLKCRCECLGLLKTKENGLPKIVSSKPKNE